MIYVTKLHLGALKYSKIPQRENGYPSLRMVIQNIQPLPHNLHHHHPHLSTPHTQAENSFLQYAYIKETLEVNKMHGVTMPVDSKFFLKWNVVFVNIFLSFCDLLGSFHPGKLSVSSSMPSINGPFDDPRSYLRLQGPEDMERGPAWSENRLRDPEDGIFFKSSRLNNQRREAKKSRRKLKVWTEVIFL